MKIAGILAIADGPFPFGDVAAAIVLGGTAIAALVCVAYTNWDKIEAYSKDGLLGLNSTLPREYSVYFLNDTNGIQYVGRVKTANWSSRESYHRATKPGLGLAFKIDNLTYIECRALEQWGITYYQTLGNYEFSNQINGVGQKNKKAPIYKAAWDYMINQAENEWLNFVDLFK